MNVDREDMMAHAKMSVEMLEPSTINDMCEMVAEAFLKNFTPVEIMRQPEFYAEMARKAAKASMMNLVEVGPMSVSFDMNVGLTQFPSIDDFPLDDDD